MTGGDVAMLETIMQQEEQIHKQAKLIRILAEQLALSQAGRAENAEHCVACGAIIPEGRQICPICEGSVPNDQIRIPDPSVSAGADGKMGLHIWHRRRNVDGCQTGKNE